MEKAHYCERFLELMVDLEVTYHVCNSLNNYFEGKSCQEVFSQHFVVRGLNKLPRSRISFANSL